MPKGKVPEVTAETNLNECGTRPSVPKARGLKSRDRVNVDSYELKRREDALVEEIVKRLPTIKTLKS
jgi:hypothetical protein